LLGLLSQFLGVIIIFLFDFSLKKEIPSFLFILFAFFVFLGQTFDAIDGKHARKTNKSSPLGQLMDHGCDAFSNSFIAIMLAQSFLFGGSIYTIILLSIIQVIFCLSF
jgi:ethanolaminephosphotransferase